MPLAVLAKIGGGAPVAVVGRGAVIIGKGAGQGAGAVIVEVADRVRQRPVVAVVMVPIMARFGEIWRQGRYGQQGGGNQKLGFGHRDSPEALLEITIFRPVLVRFAREWR